MTTSHSVGGPMARRRVKGGSISKHPLQTIACSGCLTTVTLFPILTRSRPLATGGREVLEEPPDDERSASYVFHISVPAAHRVLGGQNECRCAERVPHAGRSIPSLNANSACL